MLVARPMEESLSLKNVSLSGSSGIVTLPPGWPMYSGLHCSRFITKSPYSSVFTAYSMSTGVP